MRKTVQICELLKKEFSQLNISAQSAEKLEKFVDYIDFWNKKINLTAIKNRNDIVIKHILDSVAFEKSETRLFFPADHQQKVLDMGSGAGLPGIVLSVLYPEIHCVSIDKSEKKIGFQKYVKANLKLLNFTPIAAQLDNLIEQTEFNNGFDTVVSRAFSQLNELLFLSEKFLKPKGLALFWKGRNWKEEVNSVNDATLRQFQLLGDIEYRLHDSQFGGTVLVFRKRASTEIGRE